MRCQKWTLHCVQCVHCTALYWSVLCRYAEDWGEQMVAKVNPVIVRLSLASEQPVEASVVPGGQH